MQCTNSVNMSFLLALVALMLDRAGASNIPEGYFDAKDAKELERSTGLAALGLPIG